MSICIQEEDKVHIDKIRIDLAQAIVDIAEIKTHDIRSRHVQEMAIDGLQTVKATLDLLGLKHSSMLKYNAVALLIETFKEGDNGQTQA